VTISDDENFMIEAFYQVYAFHLLQASWYSFIHYFNLLDVHKYGPYNSHREY